MSMTIEGQRITVTTERLAATFEGAALTSLTTADGQTEFLHARPPEAGIDIFYVNRSTLGKDKHETTEATQLSSTAVRIAVKGEGGTRFLLLSLDRATGDLCVTPSVVSTRRGVAAARWSVAWHPEADLILPCINGILVQSRRAFPGNDRFPWPFRWNAQFILAQRDGHTAWIRSQDTSCKFKALDLQRDGDRTVLGFDSETTGPLWENRTAGGVEWRINVCEGDWRAPAGQYREWMEKTYDLAARRAQRPAWVDDITLAVCWQPASLAMLDALAKLHPPEQTVIHLSTWRTDRYDINYPDYIPTEEAKAYLAKANQMGFRVLPHFNYFSVYYQHPFYQQVRDFQIRDPFTNEPQGWHWPPETHDYTRMAYIHPGLSLWRAKLFDVVTAACDEIAAPGAFIDQTLCTWNTDNGLVEGMTTVEGMWRLQEEFSTARPQLVLGGEGCNEISFQREAFAQAHIHDGWGDLAPHHVEAAHPICAFLWQGHTKLIGYYHLSPGDKDLDLGEQVYRRMGALPTLIGSNPAALEELPDAYRRILERARGEGPVS